MHLVLGKGVKSDVIELENFQSIFRRISIQIGVGLSAYMVQPKIKERVKNG
jgi:hypothetical protein